MSGKWEVAGKGKKTGVGINKKPAKKQKKDIAPAEDTITGENFPVSSKIKWLPFDYK